MSWHFKFEDATGTRYQEPALITEGDSGESVQEAIADITEKGAELEIIEMENAEAEASFEVAREMQTIAEDSLEGEAVVEGEGGDEPERIRVESVGVSATGAAIMRVALSRALGQGFIKATSLKGENFVSRSGQVEHTRFVTEGVKETMKKAWQWIKDQFKKAWAKLKDWYIKIFSGAKRLKARAEKIRDRADQSSSTIDDKNFKFSGVSTLHIGGKLKTPTDFINTLKTLNKIADVVFNAPTDKMIETASDVEIDEASVSREVSKLITHWYNYIKEIPGMNASNVDSSISKHHNFGKNNWLALTGTTELPGGKQILAVGPNSEFKDVIIDHDYPIDTLRKSRIYISNTKDKPKEISSDAEAATLNNAQISEIADIVTQITDTIFTFEKKWAKTEKHETTLLKSLEDGFKELERDEADKDSASQKKIKAYQRWASAATNSVQRMASVSGVISSYMMNVTNVSLTYCEESFRHHKS